MTQTNGKLGELLTAHDPTFGLSAEILAAIAERIEVAIGNSSREALTALSAEIGSAFSSQLSSTSPELRQALRAADDRRSSLARKAFSLGQLSFAQLLASQAAERRANEGFLNTLKERRFAKYFDRLMKSDATGVELAHWTGQTEENVSRNLRHLRSIGITDFRRDGKNVVNFLTPGARAGLGAKTGDQDNMILPNEPANLVAAMRRELSGYMQSSVILSPAGMPVTTR